MKTRDGSDQLRARCSWRRCGKNSQEGKNRRHSCRASRGRASCGGGAGCRPFVSHKTLCAVICKWPKDNEVVSRAPLVSWVWVVFFTSFRGFVRNNGTSHFKSFVVCRGHVDGEICFFVVDVGGGLGGTADRLFSLRPLVHTVAMMTNRWAMSLTLCSRSGAMRAMFSLENSHEGKMWIT